MEKDSSGQASIVASSVRSLLEALVVEHAWLIDHGMADQTPELFTEDGRMLGLGEPIVGRTALADWGRARAAMTKRTSRHVLTNLRLAFESEDRVRGTVLLTLYRCDHELVRPATPLLVGDFEDTFQLCSDGRWRFQERRFISVFSS